MTNWNTTTGTAGWQPNYGEWGQAYTTWPNTVVTKEVVREVIVEKQKKPRLNVEASDAEVFVVTQAAVEVDGSGVRKIKHYVLILEDEPFCVSDRSVDCYHAEAVAKSRKA